MMNMFNPAHPGEVLRAWLPEGMRIENAAKQLHISRTTLSKVLNAKSSITAPMALRLATWLETSPDLWLGMQLQWDLRQAKKLRLPKIKPLRTQDAVDRLVA
jgi:addiction module HigA family antidote